MSFLLTWGKQKTPGSIHTILWFKLWIAPGVFCFPRITLKSQCTDFKNCFNQVINEISENASSRKLENQNWYSQPLVHTVIGRTRALRALVLSITVWTCGWENPVLVFQLPGKDTFPVFSLITYQEINILLFGVFLILGKQKTPGDIPPGVFCFPQGKQKTPGAIHNLNQSIIWIAPGVFCFPRIIKTPNNRIFISW